MTHIPLTNPAVLTDVRDVVPPLVGRGYRRAGERGNPHFGRLSEIMLVGLRSTAREDARPTSLVNDESAVTSSRPSNSEKQHRIRRAAGIKKLE